MYNRITLVCSILKQQGVFYKSTPWHSKTKTLEGNVPRMGVNINGFFRPTNLSRLKKCLSQVSRKSVFFNITITRAKINSMNIKFWRSTQNMVWSSGPHNPHFIILGLTSRSHCDVFLNSSLFLWKRAKQKSYLTFFSSYAVSIHLIRDLIKLGMEGTFS